MWRKKLKRLISSDLHKFFSLTDSNGDDESRRFGFKAETVELKVESAPQPPSKDQDYPLELWYSLTRRQQEVVALVCLGLRNYEIADILGIAPGTVKWYLEEILEKLKMRDRHTIRSTFQGWDFEAWCINHHILTTQGPNTP